MDQNNFNLENTDYMDLYVYLREKKYIKRNFLNKWAEKYNLDYALYKNKESLIKGIMHIWEAYFRENQKFKIEYLKKYMGTNIPEDLPPLSWFD